MDSCDAKWRGSLLLTKRFLSSVCKLQIPKQGCLYLISSDFCVQWETVQSAFIPVWNDSAEVQVVSRLQLGSTSMEIQHEEDKLIILPFFRRDAMTCIEVGVWHVHSFSSVSVPAELQHRSVDESLKDEAKDIHK